MSTEQIVWNIGLGVAASALWEAVKFIVGLVATRRRADDSDVKRLEGPPLLVPNGILGTIRNAALIAVVFILIQIFLFSGPAYIAT